MSYTKNTWSNGDVISKSKLDHIEDGIYTNSVTQVTVDNGVASFKNAAGDELFTLAIGGSSFVKLAENEFTVNTENTSATQIGTITIDPASDVFTSAYYIFVKIRDKAGKRAGYFLGSDTIYPNANAANGSTTSTNVAGRMLYSYTANNEFACVSQAYGIYPNYITSAGYITLYSRYHSTYSLTLNGTYKVEIFALKYPDNVSPFA